MPTLPFPQGFWVAWNWGLVLVYILAVGLVGRAVWRAIRVAREVPELRKEVAQLRQEIQRLRGEERKPR